MQSRHLRRRFFQPGDGEQNIKPRATGQRDVKIGAVLAETGDVIAAILHALQQLGDDRFFGAARRDNAAMTGWSRQLPPDWPDRFSPPRHAMPPIEQKYCVQKTLPCTR